MSPNTIACVGQACWQAVTISPSRIAPVLLLGRRSSRALIRCTQYVHFSITPRLRTVTSGLRSSLQARRVPVGIQEKLNRRTLYGQLFEQYRVPTQRL